MITDRPYRPARPTSEAVAELRRGAGVQFDPDIVDALLDLLGHDRPPAQDRARGVRMPAAPPPPPPGPR
jgi:HD-GYP domain-containing protein (c-di-GMP phosphodiesterase class II)